MIIYSQNFWTCKNFRTHFFIHQIETDCSLTNFYYTENLARFLKLSSNFRIFRYNITLTENSSKLNKFDKSCDLWSHQLFCCNWSSEKWTKLWLGINLKWLMTSPKFFTPTPFPCYPTSALKITLVHNSVTLSIPL